MVVVRSRSGGMLLLLAAAAVFSSCALASSSSGGEEEQAAPAPQYGSSSSTHDPEHHNSGDHDNDSDSDSDEEQQEAMEPEKQKERQVAKEKAVEEEKAAHQEQLKYAHENHLVSPTNGTGSYSGIAHEFLTAHNRIRQRYGVSPLKWDRKLARMARRWSNAMRMECALKHSPDHGYAQSVYKSHNNWNATARDAIDFWAGEEKKYDRTKEKCVGATKFKDCGHFALMVKKTNDRVGCARAECFKGGVFVTCNYYSSDHKDKDNKSSSD